MSAYTEGLHLVSPMFLSKTDSRNLETILATLVSSFKFELPVGKEVVWNLGGIQTPSVRGAQGVMPHMPLRVSVVASPPPRYDVSAGTPNAEASWCDAFVMLIHSCRFMVHDLWQSRQVWAAIAWRSLPSFVVMIFSFLLCVYYYFLSRSSIVENSPPFLDRDGTRIGFQRYLAIHARPLSYCNIHKFL